MDNKWFEDKFEKGTPEQLKRLATRICRSYGINGICDPMYIANVAAVELGLGDGQSHFFDRSIYDQLLLARVPLSNHESDLYAKITPESIAIIDGYEHKANVKRFKSQIDGQYWFDIPFAYSPFWEKRQ